MDARKEVRQLRRSDPRQDTGLAFEDRDFAAQLARRGGDLQPDITGADQANAPAGHQRAFQRFGVVERTQHMMRHVARPGNRARPGFRAGGQDQMVIDDTFAARQDDRVADQVYRFAVRLQACRNRLIRIEVFTAQVQVVERRLALQPGLGQRRPLIGQVGFGPDQGDLTRIAVLPEKSRGCAAGMAGPDDNDSAH